MVHLRSKRIQIDDTLDVWAAHGMGGVAGALLTGVFAEKAINSAGNNGLLFGNPGQLGIEAVSVLVTLTYAFVATFVLLKMLAPFGLRVSAQEEEEGLDLATHGEEGYCLATTPLALDESAKLGLLQAEERIAQLEAGVAELRLQLQTANRAEWAPLPMENGASGLQLQVVALAQGKKSEGSY